MSTGATPPGAAVERPLRRDERTGVLNSENLERYGARWFEPSAGVSAVVERYWHVRWRLPPGGSIVQRIIDSPAVTLSIESGAVPAAPVVTGPQQRAWIRETRDSGSAFGIPLLANDVVDELTRRVHSRTGVELADVFGVTERRVQRALQATLGKGPKWVARRIRLQEVARMLAAQPERDLAALAAELGYADQAHLIRDFRDIAGTTPGAYRRSLSARSSTPG